jgi:hypothetical protein
VPELSIWADAHGTRGDFGVFRSAAELRGFLRDQPGYTDGVISVSSGAQLLAVLDSLRGVERVGHLVLCGHGGTTWWLDDQHGVTTRAVRHRDQVSVRALAESLACVLTEDPLISLAACMCSRSPTSFLRARLGANIGSDWGRRAYTPGGQASFSARLRDALWYPYGIRARVRGHRAAGHATALALLAEHRWPAGEPCEPLYMRALDDVPPTRSNRRWWVETVTGLLAQRWLMGDDCVEVEIRDKYLADHPR